MDDTFNGPIISVRAFVQVDDDRFLLVQRSPGEYQAGSFCLPGGKVGYNTVPEQVLVDLVKRKTGLNLVQPRFLTYQNRLPPQEGMLHGLNMYFVGRGEGTISLDETCRDPVLVTPDEARKFDLAFGLEDVLAAYASRELSGQELFRRIIKEGATTGIAVSEDDIQKLHLLPGFLTKLCRDMDIYRRVTTKVHSVLEDIQQEYTTEHESLVRILQCRTKEFRSLFNKMERKRLQGTPRPYTTLNDISGVRVVVAFLDDILVVQKALEALPQGEFHIREVEDNIHFMRASGYRGLHVTVEVPVHGADFLPRCEIQVLTFSQFTWEEMTRLDVYKRGSLPSEIMQEFVHLSERFYGTDIAANEAQRRITSLRSHQD